MCVDYCVCYSYNLGSGAANITGVRMVDDGRPHEIVARRWVNDDWLLTYYQRGSLASYASPGIARAEMSVCFSVCHTLVGLLYQNEQSYRQEYLC